MCLSTVLFSACSAGASGGFLGGLFEGIDFDNMSFDDLFGTDVPDAGDMDDLYRDAIVFYDLGSEGELYDNVTKKTMPFKDLLSREIKTFSAEVTYLLTKIYGNELTDNQEFDSSFVSGLDTEIDTLWGGNINSIEYEFSKDKDYFQRLESFGSNHSLDGCTSCGSTTLNCSYGLSDFFSENNTTLTSITASKTRVEVFDLNSLSIEKIGFGAGLLSMRDPINYELLKGYYTSSTVDEPDPDPFAGGALITITEYKINSGKSTMSYWTGNATMSAVYTNLCEYVAQALVGGSLSYDECLENTDHLGFTSKDIKRIKETILNNIIKDSSAQTGINNKYYLEVVNAVVDFVAKRTFDVGYNPGGITGVFTTEEAYIYVSIPRMGMKSVDIDLLLTDEVKEDGFDITNWGQGDLSDYFDNALGDMDSFGDMLSYENYKPVFEDEVNVRGVLLMPELDLKYADDYEGVTVGSYNIIVKNESGGDVKVKFTVDDNGTVIFDDYVGYSKLVDMENYESFDEMTFEDDSNVDGGEFGVQGAYEENGGDEDNFISDYEGEKAYEAIEGSLDAFDPEGKNQYMRVWNKFLGIQELPDSDYGTAIKLLDSKNYILSMFDCTDNVNMLLTLMYFRISIY